jgi:hypothetical protein
MSLLKLFEDKNKIMGWRRDFKISKDWIPNKHIARLKEDQTIAYHGEKIYDMTIEGLYYEINSLGHRSHFTPNDVKSYGIVVGCSHTFGTAVSYSNLYHQCLNIDTPVYNLGIAGCSNEVSIHNLSRFLTLYKKPEFVIFQVTNKERLTTVTDDSHIKNLGLWSLAEEDENITNAMLGLDGIKHFEWRYTTHINIVKALCRDIPLVFVHHPSLGTAHNISDETHYLMRVTEGKFAADGMHSCEEDHVAWGRDLGNIIKRGP